MHVFLFRVVLCKWSLIAAIFVERKVSDMQHILVGYFTLPV
jgi:hypothetical protein